MTVLANCCPKSGSHLLMAWFQTMGLKREPGIVEAWHEKRELAYRKTEAEKPGHATIEQLRALDHRRFCHAHVHARAGLPDGFMVVTIFRDPRNVLVSYVRHQERVHGRQIGLVDALHDFLGCPFIEVYRSFFGWRGRSLCLRYEDFPPGFAGDGAGLYAQAKRDHNTWTGEPSNWRDVWDYEIDHEWRDAGGWFLVRDAGYA